MPSENPEVHEFAEDGWSNAPIPDSGLPPLGSPELPDPAMLELFQEFKIAFVSVRPATDEQLWEYIRVFLGIAIPRIAVCPGHQSPFQAIADLFFLRHPNENLLLVGGRGTGKTLGFAIAEFLLLHFDADTIANVGAVEEQAKKCYSYIQRINLDPLFGQFVASSMLSRTRYKNGGEIEILPGTMNRVNSPHPRLACLDEVDLMPWAVMQEALSMPVRTNGRAPQTVYTSSLKKRYGPMVRLMDEAQERALRTYTFCVFEVIERCPEDRHKGGIGCQTCPLKTECLDQEQHADGTIEYFPGPGRASRAEGFMKIDDVIKSYRSLDPDTWDSQWRCKQPSAKNLIYPMFDPQVHVIDYEWQPNLPVYSGIDFGYTNPSVAIYVQVLPNDEIVIFAEDYKSMRDDTELAESIKSTPWFATTQFREGDPAAAVSRANLARAGVHVRAAINTKDLSKDDSGISKIRWLLAPKGRDRPLLFVAKQCVNTIREWKAYHNKEQSALIDRNAPEEAAKVEDHCMDAVRYCISRLVRHKEVRGD